LEIKIRGSPKFMKFYDSLDKSGQLFLEIDSVFDLLKQKHDLGNRIQQKIWPKCYVDAFDVTNLFRLQLSRGKRMIYTVYTVSGIVYCNVLEIFPNHKEYEKRSGY
jgi:hypothetical protein